MTLRALLTLTVIALALCAWMLAYPSRAERTAYDIARVVEGSNVCGYQIGAFEAAVAPYQADPKDRDAFVAAFETGTRRAREAISSLRDGRLSGFCTGARRTAARLGIALD